MDRQQKPAFLFYASNMDVISVYPEEVQRMIIIWIFQYGFEGKVSDCPDDLQDVLAPIFDGVDVQKRRYKNIEFLNSYIATLQYRTAHLIEKHYSAAVNNAVLLLKREIVKCQKNDVPEEFVRKRAAAIALPTEIKTLMGMTDEKKQSNASSQTSETPYGPRVR